LPTLNDYANILKFISYCYDISEIETKQLIKLI